MKRSAYASLFILVALSACNKDKPAAAPTGRTSMMDIPASAPALPPGHPSTDPGGSAMMAPAMSLPSLPSQGGLPSQNQNYELTQKGTVVSFIDIPEFTYLEVKQNGTTRWLATRTITVKKGDTVKFDNGATMENFKSKSLNRTFPSMTFVNKVVVTKG